MPSHPGANAFGDLLREHRTHAGISQEVLAERARISVAAVGALERGIRRAPYRSTVALLAKALDLSEDETFALAAARDGARAHPPKTEAVEHVTQPRTSFVGRDPDIAQIIKLFAKSRLVTIAGFGGIGKTRAALEVLQRVVPAQWPDAWFVDLAPLTDSAFIPAKIASSVRPVFSESATTAADVARVLASRHTLIVLDNCEHLVAEVSEAVDVLLSLCPRVTVLATSREPLNIAGEFVYRLPALSLADDAVQLFVQRAEAADPSIVFDEANLAAVATIVRRLDGIPLAIEIAAAQLPMVGLQALEAHLDGHFNIPALRRDLPARQQTTVATIRWSYDLLSPDERELLRSASIFSGGFTLAAAETVCESASLERSSVLPLLSSLVNKSLVQAERAGERVRYRLLDSVRSFGVQLLRESGDETNVARAHARWLATIGERLHLRYDVTPWEDLAWLMPEIDNIRSAIRWSLDAESQDDRGYAGHIIVGCSSVWERIGGLEEHRRWVEMALERIDEAQHPRVVARLLRDLIARAFYETGTLFAIERAVALNDRIDDPDDILDLHSGLISTYAVHGMFEDAERSAQRAAAVVAMKPELLTSVRYAVVLAHRSTLRKIQGRIDEARADLVAAEAIARACGDRYFVILHCWSRLCTIELVAGNLERALEIAEQMLASEHGPFELITEESLRIVGGLRLLLGDVDGAVEAVREILDLPRYDTMWFNSTCVYAATAAALRGHIAVAARLSGFVRAREDRTGFRPGLGRKSVDELLRTTLAEHPQQDLIASAGADGGRMTEDEALLETRAALDAASAH